VTSSAEEQTTTHHIRLPESSILTVLQALDTVFKPCQGYYLNKVSTSYST